MHHFPPQGHCYHLMPAVNRRLDASSVVIVFARYQYVASLIIACFLLTTLHTSQQSHVSPLIHIMYCKGGYPIVSSKHSCGIWDGSIVNIELIRRLSYIVNKFFTTDGVDRCKLCHISVAIICTISIS